MSKSKVRNVVSVEVDDFQPEVPKSIGVRFEKSPRRRAQSYNLVLVGAIHFRNLLIGFASLWVGRSNIGSRTEVVFAITALLSGVAWAAITGKYYATESMRENGSGWLPCQWAACFWGCR